MKFATAKEHRNFFNKHHLLEVEDIVPSDQLQALLSGITETLAKRMHVKINELYHQDQSRIFAEGRDLWRASTVVKKLVTSRSPAEIASELFMQKVVRLGCDQLIPFITPWNKTSTLEEVVSLQGIICGLVLGLKGELQTEEISILPKKPGNGVFFSPDIPLNLPEVNRNKDSLYLLIVYTKQTAVYVHKHGDPNGHFLRQVGYSFGDKLNDKLNPIVYR